jgi:hypothetical protein
MSERPDDIPAWWATGLLFENCSCQAICPGHVHFDQVCYGERCIGYWAIRFDAGELDGVDLAGVSVVIAYDCPPHMIDGDWIEAIVIDERASKAQRDAVERIVTGRAGGPWATLARFVGEQLPTRYLPIEIDEANGTKQVKIDGILESTVEQLKGRDRSRPVTFENIYNQIHPPQQVIGTGTSTYDDGRIRFATERTHGLYSRFEWRVG